MRKKLIDVVKEKKNRMVIPLMFFPGVKLTNSTIKQNAFNSYLQGETIKKLYERFRPDGMFFMMDLSVEAGAVGLPIRYPLDDSPTVEEHPVKEDEDLKQLEIPFLSDCRIKLFLEVMELMKKTIPVLCGGYVIGPFTLTGLLMGASQVSVAVIDRPEFVHKLLGFSSEIIRLYARGLVEKGADMIAILEPTAIILSPTQFREFSANYIEKIIQDIEKIFILHICGDTTHLISEMAKIGVDGFSLDSPVDFNRISKIVPEDTVLIGNIPPVEIMVESSSKVVKDYVLSLLESMAGVANFIISTGCDLPCRTPLENIEALIETAKGWKE